MPTKFVQVHTLTSYPASLLNRDDAGFAKRMPFGGAVRTRISSQCLKRHWRTFKGDWDLSSIGADSIRSRELFSRLVLPKVLEAGVPDSRARWAVGAVVALLQVGTASNAKKKRQDVAKKFAGVGSEADADSLKQIVVLGPSEVDYLASEAVQLGKGAGKDEDLVEAACNRATREQKENLEALATSVSKGAGISAALFGRMRTGDLFAETSAAIHVAHAITVHGQMTESDYFTAIDDLVREEGQQGSGHINASELTSGLFYGYVVVDVEGLVANLGRNRQLAADVVDRLVHLVATVSPGAKKGSTAPYAYSHLVLVEAGSAQPRTLQNAFIEPVPTSGNVVTNTYAALRQHLSELDAMYASGEERAHTGLHSDGFFDQRMPLGQLAEWAKAQVA